MSKNKSKEGWTGTVLRMKNKNGCPINDEEAKMIIDYLAEKYPHAKILIIPIPNRFFILVL